ncbi:hypothetical protein MASR1M32_19350 [Rhodobacter sp.]
MSVTRDSVLGLLGGIALPGGGTFVSRDLIRALTVEEGAAGATIRFVIEAATPDEARALGAVQAQAEAALKAMPGVAQVSAVMTAHGPAKKEPPPQLKIGGHPTAQQGGPQKVSGVARIIAVASGKGGVGKSTVSSNLAVALARQGRKVGLLDADILGPSQAKMMGVSERPASPDGQTIIPPEAHGVKMMSLGLMLREDEAVIWRGPMLMGALQQLLGQVALGDAGCSDRRSAARHRRCAADPVPAHPADRGAGGLHPAGRGASGCAQGHRHVRQAEDAGPWPDREHVDLCLPQLRA